MSVKQTRYDDLPSHELARDPSEPLYPRGVAEEHQGRGVLSGILEIGPKAKLIAAIGVTAAVAAGLGGRDIANRIEALAHPQTKTELIDVHPPTRVAGGTSAEVMTVQQQVIENSGK